MPVDALGSRAYKLHRLRSLILALGFERESGSLVSETGDAGAGLVLLPAKPAFAQSERCPL